MGAIDRYVQWHVMDVCSLLKKLFMNRITKLEQFLGKDILHLRPSGWRVVVLRICDCEDQGLEYSLCNSTSKKSSADLDL